VQVADAVILDGSASSDPDGNTLSYSWSLMTVPAKSAAALGDSSSDKPSFIADMAGTYVARLVVNDGNVDSMPDDVTIAVVVPPPTVTIVTPEPLSLLTTKTATVAGAVDDPLATITVNGNATPNNNGSYSADVTLSEGGNTVTVEATNGTGTGTASVDVIVKTLPGPVMNITSHGNDFTVGTSWDGCGAPPSTVPAEVHGTIATPNGPPTVTVNGETAVLQELTANPFLVAFCKIFPNAAICSSLDNTRYSFSATVQLSKGQQTIAAVGDDSQGSTTVQVSGVADYCHIAEEGTNHCDVASIPAERGNNQNNVCHAIDGCSSGSDPASDAPRNQPMKWAVHNVAPVEFGSGTIPPTEFFVHGLAPARALGCNIHDTCYQTCVPQGGGDQILAYNSCNWQQYGNHLEACRKSYPTALCPYTGLELLKCPGWRAEKEACFRLALVYLAGVESLGIKAYNDRQAQYCNP
jgi:hypothetical protein